MFTNEKRRLMYHMLKICCCILYSLSRVSVMKILCEPPWTESKSVLNIFGCLWKTISPIFVKYTMQETSDRNKNDAYWLDWFTLFAILSVIFLLNVHFKNVLQGVPINMGIKSLLNHLFIFFMPFFVSIYSCKLYVRTVVNYM